jgi:hypothetical protein
LLILYLSANEVAFTTEVHDPIYNATRLIGQILVSDVEANITVEGTKVYMANEPASPLGCRVQYQYCNPNLPLESQCFPLASSSDAIQIGVPELFPPEDVAAITRMFWAYYIAFGDFDHSASLLRVLGPGALLGRYGLGIDGIQGILPDNQWQLDAEHWFSISMAAIQLSFVTAAIGPNDPAIQPWFRKPNDTAEFAMCDNQVRIFHGRGIAQAANSSCRKFRARRIRLSVCLDCFSLWSLEA